MYQIYDDWTCPEIEKIQEMVFEDGFKYEVGRTVDGTPDTQIALYHAVQERIENTNGIPVPKTHLYHTILKIIFRFCFDKNIDFSVLCRASINFVYPKAGTVYPEHVDHHYSHHSILFYLNDADGDTVLHDEDVRVTPKKGRVLFFDGQPHSVIAPENSERIVLVTTIA